MGTSPAAVGTWFDTETLRALPCKSPLDDGAYYNTSRISSQVAELQT